LSSAPWAALAEMLLVFGIVIGGAVWSLVRLRREQARDREAQRRAEESDRQSGA